MEAFKLVNALRQEGISAESDHLARSIKAQMKYANKIGARYSAILGESELENGEIQLKEMESGDTVTIPLNQFVQVVKTTIKGIE